MSPGVDGSASRSWPIARCDRAGTARDGQRSTARRRAIVIAQVDTLARSGSKRAAVRHSSRNTSWVTSSDIAGSRSTRLTVPENDTGELVVERRERRLVATLHELHQRHEIRSRRNDRLMMPGMCPIERHPIQGGAHGDPTNAAKESARIKAIADADADAESADRRWADQTTPLHPGGVRTRSSMPIASRARRSRRCGSHGSLRSRTRRAAARRPRGVAAVRAGRSSRRRSVRRRRRVHGR